MPPTEGWTWRGSGVRSAGLEDRCRGCSPTLRGLRPLRKQELVRPGRSDFKTAAATSAAVTWRVVRRHRTRPLGWSLGSCGSRTAGIGLDARAGRVGRVEQPITGCTPDKGCCAGWKAGGLSHSPFPLLSQWLKFLI